MPFSSPLPANAVAIIGLAGRFPDAGSIEEFWQNIRAGVESVRPFTDDELTAAGEPLHPQRHEPNYVRARASIRDRAMFDAKFFGFPPREAEQMDPQQRLFLECAWEALENAGCDSERFTGAVGVYAGCYMDSYIFSNLCAQPGFLKDFTVDIQVGPLGPELANDKDHIATRVAFKLDLRGPAINVQTACSTSLVAVCQAAQALLTHQCDMALAGGATLTFRHATGYLHQEGGMLSSDGHCRAYDHRATGTVFGEGVACVLLKRLEDAVADGDHITAVIRAAALNNDGAAKVSYAAPSVAGQTEVIALAHAIADVDPATIQYVEGHGTGTPLGDPIEVAALTAAFRAGTDKKQFCALGSVKPNIGHLDTASGVTGMIKAALALRDRVIPPLINFEQRNPQIDFANSPFYLPTELQPWTAPKATPRRAGVSSFGVGGTNAHVVLEEAPPLPERAPVTTPQLLVLSAKSAAALEAMTARLGAHLRAQPDLPLADVAATLQTGRRQFNLRRSLVARDTASAIAALESGDPKKLPTVNQDRRNPPVVFMFPGQGSQYVNMGVELYRHQPVFRAEIDRCAEILRPHLGFDLREAIYAPPENKEAATAQLTQTRITQPALFATEYAIARQWMEWGIQPAAMIGHSVGEYVAGCLAGVFSLEDALALVAARARLVQEMPPGGMLAVRLAESEVAPLLDAGLSVAAINSPSLCVVAGPYPALEALEAKLAAQKTAARRLHTSHGFHSAMMDPVVAPFTAIVAKVPLAAPTIPYVSNVTGQWVTAAETTDPAYWAAHVRQAVRFADGIGTLLANPEYVFLEIGPGTTLQTLTRQHPAKTANRVVLSSLPTSNDGAGEIDTLLANLGQLWLAGAGIDWAKLTAHENPRRVPLPTYPFERKKHWIEPVPFETPAPAALPELLIPSTRPAIPAPEPLMSTPNRRETIESELKRILYNLSGIELSDSDGGVTFLELGFDSLLLTQARQALQSGLGVSVTFRQLMDDFGTLDALTDHADSVLPADAFAAPAPLPVATLPAMPMVPMSTPVGGSAIEQLIVQQLQLMQEQLAALRGQPIAMTPGARPGPAALAPKPEAKAAPPSNGHSSKNSEATVAHGPFKPQSRGRADGLSPTQQAALDRLVARYNAKTAKSKELTQKHRPHFCDPRAAGNFRQLWKEMVYPIACARSKGSKIWDIDGNEYVDVTLGFGVHFLGHSPDFVIDAVQEQLQKGTEIGPQSPIAGEVAKMITEFSGMERVTFCNTGSEAVMAAMRVARTVTGRNKIAMFSGDYHGMFDSVLVRGFKIGGQWKTAPIAPGIPQSQVDDMVVLELNNPESLEYLRAHASEIAAVIVEPVQARNPDVQPRDFLHALRALTKETGMLYVFDEVITGFRCAPGGAQEYFGVRADLATYGKIVGGGIPIGVLAGKAEYMDVLDGGQWQYGDGSYPEVGVTFFAGTFVRHPLAMAAAHAVLTYLKEQGPGLQQRISEKAKNLVASLNALFREQGVPMSLMNFCSLMHYELDAKWEFGGLLFYYLRDRGVHIWEGRLGFISCAHTDEDCAFLYGAFKGAVLEMKEAGFLPEGPNNPGPRGITPEQASAPLTAAQDEIFTTTRFAPEATNAYNESNTLTLRGALDVEKLRAAFQQVVNRHDALRATFAEDGSRQTFLTSLTVDLPLHDLHALPLSEREEEARALVAADLTTSFDLARGPLIRTQLIRMTPDEHRLLITAHHLVCDGWSFDIVQSELAAIYSSLIGGSPPEIGPPPRFADYVHWEIAQRTAPETQSDEEFWVQQFQTIPEPIALPTDRPHPRQRSYRGARAEFLLPPEMTKQLTRVGGKNGSTLFAVLLAGFQTMLHRLSGSTDLVVGISTAGQNLAEQPGLVGHCVNVLPLRVQTSAELPFRGLLHSVRDAMFATFEHPRLSYGRLLQRITCPREAGRVPLVPVIFNLDPSLRDLRFAGLEHQTATSPRQAYQFDLGWNIVATRAGLRIECDYNTDILDAATVQRWLGHYRELLAAIIAAPETALGQLPLLETSARAQMIELGRGPATDYPADTALAELFSRRAAKQPDAIAVIDGDRRFTFANVEERANQVANHLLSLGLKPGQFVGLRSERAPRFIWEAVGVLRAGGAYLPVAADEPADRMKTIEETCAVLLLAPEPYAAASTGPVALTVDAGQPAYLLYTSGSTGQPKGVVVPHRAVTRLVWNTNYFAAHEDFRVAFASSLSFDAATFEIWSALLLGGAAVVTPHEVLLSPTALEAHFDRHQITTIFLTTALFNRTVQAVPAIFRKLRYVIFGGERVDAGCVRLVLAHGKPEHLVHAYGPTEATTFATSHDVTHAEGATVPIGQPIANTDAFILDAHGEPVPYGVVGEIHLGGPGLAVGYHGDPTLTAERFLETPLGRLYRTGDLACWRADGTIEITGRRDQQIKMRGFRIEPGEIEAALKQLPGIEDAAVVLRRDHGDPQLVAYCVRSGKSGDKTDAFSERPFANDDIATGDESAASTSGLAGALRSKLPKYMIPSAFVFLDQLPLTPSGKLDRAALPAAAATVPESHAIVAATKTVEAELIEIWEEVLQRQPIGIRDDFFALGGHSLRAAQVVSLLAERLGQRLDLGEFFDHPTIEKHALRLSAIHPARRAAPFPTIHSEGPATPLFFFHGDLLGGGLFCQTLAREIGSDRPFCVLPPHGLEGDDIPATIEAMAVERVRWIREVQPHGPYLLGGYCHGALLAHETARLLREAGEPVAAVLMLYADGSNINLRTLQRVSAMTGAWRGEDAAAQRQRFLKIHDSLAEYSALRRHYAGAMVDLLKQPPHIQASRLWRKTRRILRRFVPQSFRAPTDPNGTPAASASPRHQEAIVNTYDDIVRAYIPRPSDAPVILLWPEEEPPPSSHGPATGWERICARVEVVAVPGNHSTSVAQSANVVKIGAAMRKSIVRAESLLSQSPP